MIRIRHLIGLAALGLASTLFAQNPQTPRHIDEDALIHVPEGIPPQASRQLEQARHLLAQAQAHDPVAAADTHTPGNWPRGRGLLGSIAGGRMETACFLGVSISPITPPLREHLKLHKGMGLLVEHVEAGSPAESAGIKPLDILQKLDDQQLINIHQLVVLVRSFKEGDSVKITLIRQGQPQVVTAKLVEKSVPALDENSPWGSPPLMFRMMPGDLRLGDPADSDSKHLPPWGSILAQPGTKGGQVMVWSDSTMTLTVTTKPNGQRWLHARDADGKKLYDGVIENDQQLEKLPAAVRERLDMLNKQVPHSPQPPTAPNAPSHTPGSAPTAPTPPHTSPKTVTPERLEL